LSIFLKSLSGFLLAVGIGWGIYIVVAVATHMEGFSSLIEMFPALVFHAAPLFVGMLLFGLGRREGNLTS